MNCFQELTAKGGTVSEMKYKDYYMKSLENANQFQDFVCINLIKNGIVLSNLSSRKYQFEMGENLQGFEIKHDHLFRKTGNLYIEIAEKSNPINENYITSGVHRIDNSWIYCIGDYISVFLIQKQVLKAILNKGNYKKVENQTKTSLGYLYPVEKAREYFTEIIFPIK